MMYFTHKLSVIIIIIYSKGSPGVLIQHEGTQKRASDNLFVPVGRGGGGGGGGRFYAIPRINTKSSEGIDLKPVQRVLYLHLGKHKNTCAAVWRHQSCA